MLAVERDKRFVGHLQQELEQRRLARRVQLRRADLRSVPLPEGPYRVVRIRRSR